MRSAKGPVFLFFGFVLAGTSVVAARFVSGKLGLFTITSVSLVFALLFLFSFRLRKILQAVKELPLKTLLHLVLQALCGIFLFRLFLLCGIFRTSSGEAGILTSATPAITAVLAMVFLKEKANGIKLCGIALTIAGILILQGVFSPDTALSREHFLGNLLVLFAAACESLFNIVSRRFSHGNGEKAGTVMDPAVQTALVSAIALLFCLVPALLEHPVQRLSALSQTGWAALVWYGVFVTALAYICWYQGILRCGALTAAAFSGMMPLTSVLLSVLLLGESFGWQKVAGGLLVAAGMVVIGIGAASDQEPSKNRR